MVSSNRCSNISVDRCSHVGRSIYFILSLCKFLHGGCLRGWRFSLKPDGLFPRFGGDFFLLICLILDKFDFEFFKNFWGVVMILRKMWSVVGE